MKHTLLALTLSLFLLAFWGVGTALADTPVQAVGQTATNSQTAVAASEAAQQQPQNQNISVRVLSPGDDGSVTQSNTVGSTAVAANANSATQAANQAVAATGCGCSSVMPAIAPAVSSGPSVTAPSSPVSSAPSQANTDVSGAGAANANLPDQSARQAAPGGSGTQAVGQHADSQQKAAAISHATQTQPKNSNISVRVLSPGDDGFVSQENRASSGALAANLDKTTQHADQSSSGSSGTQAVGQSSSNDQKALAKSAADQQQPKNGNISVRVLSPGDGGSVSQSNDVTSKAAALNANTSHQTATQDPVGTGCGCEASGVQTVGQKATNSQTAAALSFALQHGATNSNSPVRIASPGDEGSVTQRNSVASAAGAINADKTEQTATQTDPGGAGVQAIGQSTKNEQLAAALSAAIQAGASNSNTPVRIGSEGGGGSVFQNNAVESHAAALNVQKTDQGAMQTARSGTCCGSADIQAIGQSAESSQRSFAISKALQLFGGRSLCECGSAGGNVNVPVRIWSPDGDGSVFQTNDVRSKALGLNANATHQLAGQSSASGCGCGSVSPIQAIGQSETNDQFALGLSAALQAGALNVVAPIRLWSLDGFGRGFQTNDASSLGASANANGHRQLALQAE